MLYGVVNKIISVHIFFFASFFFSFIFISWRLIKYCSGFLPYIDMNQPWKSTYLKKTTLGDFPGGTVDKKIHLPIQGTQVRSLVQEDPTYHMPQPLSLLSTARARINQKKPL